MKVSVDVSETTIAGDYTDVDGLCLRCPKCNHSVEVYGTGDSSARRGAIMLRDECPLGENNFYDVSEWTG